MQGSCECGAVAIESAGPWGDVIACHCATCRKTSGHFWAAASVRSDSLKFIRDDGLAWYESTDQVRRGFCERCGSSLFYEFKDQALVGVATGSLDGATGLRLGSHIFTSEKGDYYTLSKALPRFAGDTDRGYAND